VAWALSRRYEKSEARRRLAEGIRGRAARAGEPGAFHETITAAWFELASGVEDLAAHPELLDRELLARYYSAEALAAGRDKWVPPDLHALRLPPPPAPAVADLFAVMRRLPAAVAVLSTRAGPLSARAALGGPPPEPARPHGTVHASTVSSTAAVSRTPPLVSVCLANGSRTLAMVAEARTFTLSYLAFDQADLAARFSTTARPAGAEQFSGVAHHLSSYGPVIAGCALWVGCHLEQVHPAGDHQIVLGRVAVARSDRQRLPLLR